MIPTNLLKRVRLVCLSVVILTIMMNHSNAEIPSLLNYQGQVTNSGTGEPLDSIVSIVFSIYDDSVTATPLWTETYTSIAVVDGLFAVLLGSQNPVPESIFGDAERWLGIKVGADSEIAPRTRFVSAAYSFHSLYADSAGTGDDGDWTDDGGGNIYRLSGNIGIGTTSPTFKVDVRTPDDLNDGFRLSAGPYNIISTQNGGVQLKPYPSDWADAVLIQNYGSGGVARTQIMTTSSMGENGRPNLTYPHLSLQPNGGNVGIGTTNPAAKLHIIDTYSGGKYVTHFNKYGSGPGYIGFNRGTAGGRSYFVFDSAYFGIYTSNGSESSWYNLSFAGNTGVLSTNASFGIGTTSPAKKLQVNASAADAALRLHAPAGDNNRPTPYLLFTGGYKTNNGAAISGKNDQIFGQTALSFYAGWNTSTHGDDPGIGDLYERMRIASNGNVGIGTTSPSQKLHVAGAVAATTYYGDGSNLTGISGTTDNDWTISASNMYSAVSGNVGIATTSPSSKLHVVGTVRFDNALTVNGPGGSVNAVTANTNGAFAALAGLNSGLGSGVYAESNSIQNKIGAVHGKALQNGGAGIYGETNSAGVTGGSSLGVFGEATNTGGSTGGAALAVLGRVWSYQQSPASVPVGVFGEAMHATGVAWGIAGETHSTASTAAGVKGTLKASGATGRAIWGEAPSTGWAGYFQGNVHVTGNLSASGSKPAVLDNFEDGKTRYIYSQESPEVWFEDFGEGQLKQGVANIVLDALFLETVTINNQHPMKVFVTLNGECNGVYVKRGSSSFVVKELNNGKSSAQFTYRVVAKRKGFENERLEIDDKFLASTEATNQNE